MESIFQASEKSSLTCVKHSSIDPALRIADRHTTVGVVEEDFHAAGPGRGSYTISVISAPVPH